MKMKQNRLDKLRAQLADTSKMGPHSILPVAILVNNPSVVPSAAAGVSSSADAAASLKVIQPSPSVTTRSQKKVPPDTICLDAEEVVDGGVASSSIRRFLVRMPPEQLLGESYCFTTEALACFRGSIAYKLKTEKELAAAQYHIYVLKAERDYALAYLPLKEELKEDNKVLSTQLASCQLFLEREQKKVEAAMKDLKALYSSLVERETALSTTNASAEFWEAEWKKLGEETLDMCQETLEIVLDQGRRIYKRKESAGEDSEMVEDPPYVDAKQQPEQPEQVQQPEPENVAGEGRECPT
ncbi:hypothetical protein PIB30_022612 [Stylosanthes scabra]|uniref:Uncharacterized protein n=1 Tax=Stylosanthes scabra TaxID=79078 RepID=A0ABU6S9W5_9FABA|nr:hypothetical protein [Stylosanthes scabra]